MRYQAFMGVAAAVLSTTFFSTGNVLAQNEAQAVPQPRTMTDTAPLPASDRGSVGAVILMDDPVIAQREAMQQMASRAPDTSTMGAGPNRLLQRVLTDEERKQQRALDAAGKR